MNPKAARHQQRNQQAENKHAGIVQYCMQRQQPPSMFTTIRV